MNILGVRHWTKFQASKKRRVSLHLFKSQHNLCKSCPTCVISNLLKTPHLCNPTIPNPTMSGPTPRSGTLPCVWPKSSRAMHPNGTAGTHPEVEGMIIFWGDVYKSSWNGGKYGANIAGKYHHPNYTTMDFISMLFFHVLGHFKEGWLKPS